MPDLVWNSLAVGSDGLGLESKPAVANSNSAVRSLIATFESVFDRGSDRTDSTTKNDIPATTFVEFVRVHLSSEWSLALQHHVRQLVDGGASADAKSVDSPVNKIRVSSVHRAVDSMSLSRALTIDRTR
jgi:hypothetical protein